MIMKNILKFLGIAAVAALAVSCQQEPDPGGTQVQDMAGEWWVHYEVETSPGTFEDVVGGYVKLMTFNTASNSDTIWITDLDHFWEFQVKAAASPSTKEFSITEETEIVHGADVTIEDGKVLTGKGKSISGVTTDSIHFVVSFSDEIPVPYETKFRVSGHRRTGFLEDELE